MPIQKFEDLIIWKKSQAIAIEVYSNFREIKVSSFKHQIQTALISISNNIAKEFERKSMKEFSRFFGISLASCSEVRSILYLSFDSGFII